MPHNYADFEDALEREDIDEEEYLSYFREKRDAFTDFYLNDETLDMYVLDEMARPEVTVKEIKDVLEPEIVPEPQVTVEEVKPSIVERIVGFFRQLLG